MLRIRDSTLRPRNLTDISSTLIALTDLTLAELVDDFDGVAQYMLMRSILDIRRALYWELQCGPEKLDHCCKCLFSLSSLSDRLLTLSIALPHRWLDPFLVPEILDT